MCKKLVLLLALMSVVAISGYGTTKKQFSMVRIELGHNQDTDIDNLRRQNIDITYYNGEAGYIDAIVDEDQIRTIRESGFLINPIVEDLKAHAEQLRTGGYFDLFHTYDEMLAEMQQIVTAHPDIASLHDIGDSYNKVHDRGGYDIWALKISDHVEIDDKSEADALFMANIHAREIITPEIIMYFMHYLVDRYGTDSYVTHLVNNREIWLIPMINPDGHEYVFSGDIANLLPINNSDPIWWRKNMSDNDSSGTFNSSYDGVDLNRNFGYQWGYNDIGSRGRPGSLTYRGLEPFSEPESQAIRDFVGEHNFITSLSYHSYGRLWLYPWGYAEVDPPEPDLSSFAALADCCVAYNGYRPGNIKDGISYEINGCQEDWLYGEHGIFAFLPEVGNGAQGWFWPDTSLVMIQVLENLGPNLYMSYAAGEEPIVKYERLADIENAPEIIVLTTTIEPPILLTEYVPLDSSSFNMYYNLTGKTPFDSVRLTPTGNLNEYSAEVPGQKLDGTVYYFVSASDQIGRVGTSPHGAPAALDSFLIAPDITSPTIIHEPLNYLMPSDTVITINANITDNNGVSEVWLQLFHNTEGMSEVAMELVEDDEYVSVIDSLFLLPGDSIKYRIKAIDVSQNRNTTYVPEEGFYSFGILRSEYYHDFETDSICSTNEGSDWEWGAYTGSGNAHSGEKLWGTRIDGIYSKNSDSRLDVPEIILHQNLKAAVFHFWHLYATETIYGAIWDGGNVKISIDNEPFQVVIPSTGYDGLISFMNNTIIGGEPGFGGSSGGSFKWKHTVINLTEYIGHSVRLQFHFVSNGSGQRLGWYVDDMELLVFPATEVGVKYVEIDLPQTFELSQNYPNPFNSSTIIRYSIPTFANVELSIYNSMGQLVKRLIKKENQAGTYQIEWNGTNNLGESVGSGVYFLTLKTSDFRKTRKILFLK